MLYQLVSVVPVAGKHGDADTGSDRHLMTVEFVRQAQCLDHSLCQCLGVMWLIDA